MSVALENLPTFAARLRAVREGRRDPFGKRISQRKAAQALNVDTGTYANWEAARNLPDPRSRVALEGLWPEVFQKA